MKLKLIASSLLLAGSLRPGNTFFATGKVLPSAEADGSMSEAFKYSGLTLVRNNIPGELAVQVGGADPTYPGRIFSKDPGTSYFLTDAGSQWASPVASGQPVLAVLEAFAGQNGWTGDAYAGAARADIEKPSIARALVTFPDAWMTKIPVPSLNSADPMEIRLKIEQFKDLSGLATGLSLWRRELGVQNWSFLNTLPLPPLGGAGYVDQGVASGKVYEYSASVNYEWPGGSGAGSRPLETGLYSTMARSKGFPIAASLTQPTPVPALATPKPDKPLVLDLADGWLPYPNPVLEESLHVAIDMPGPGLAIAKVFSIEGTKVKEWKQAFTEKGQIRALVSLKGLSSGIYIMKLFIETSEGAQTELKAKKIAVLR